MLLWPIKMTGGDQPMKSMLFFLSANFSGYFNDPKARGNGRVDGLVRQNHESIRDDTTARTPLGCAVLALDLVYGPPKFDLLVQFNSSQ